MARIIWISVGILVLVAAVGAIVLNALIGRYLRGEDFRDLVSAKTSSIVRVEGRYQPLRWTGASVYSDSFHGTGPADSPVREIDARGVRAMINWRAAFRGAWRIDQVNIRRLDAVFQRPELRKDSNLREEQERIERRAARELPSWLPNVFEIGTVTIDSATLESAGPVLKDSNLILTSDDHAWVVDGQGGRFLHPGIPTLGIEDFRARLAADSLFLTHANLRPPKRGAIQATGEFPLTDGAAFTTRIDWNGMDSAVMLPARVSRYLNGTIEGTAAVTGLTGTADSHETEGRFLLTEGMAEGVPALDKLATFTQSPQFKRMPVQEMSGKFKHVGERLEVTDFVLESKGLLRVEGAYRVGPGGSLAGEFQVGLTPQTLRWIPGSQERVFTVSRDGYLWTDVRVGGTVDAPSENLSARLARAMGEHAVESGIHLLFEAPETATETAADAAKEAVKEGKDAVKTILSPFVR